ncbi:MAG: FAD-dependent oxidoreductase [Phycisphaerae bacterium]|jgi:glycine/D-amino acid oxidase-like deaminating enzyme|nr:FAD-dependent oxidoreductase [Phycisphaerae bacterium]
MSEAYDVVVVGGGIVGAACGAACGRGGMKVLVLERGLIGGGATATAMGHVVVMDDSQAQLALTAYSRRLWHELADELPTGAEYDRCGTIWVAADDEEMDAVEQKHAAYRGAGLQSTVLDAAELARAEPSLRSGLAGGLLVSDDVVLYPPVAAKCLLDRAEENRVEIRTGAEVRSISSDGTVTLADGTTIAAGSVVNAAGCFSPSLTPGLPVRGRKGHLVITDRYPGYINHQLIELGYLKSAHSVQSDSVAMNIQPRKTGQMLIGSSRQFDAEGSEAQLPIVDRMIRRATRYVPSLGQLSAIRIWAGHRAATPDKLPLIGPSIAGDRIWLATGHEGLGITTSLGTGQLLADLMLGRSGEIPAEPYSPKRFAEGGD